MPFAKICQEHMNVNALKVMMVMHVKHVLELKLTYAVKETMIVRKMLNVLEIDVSANKALRSQAMNVLILMNVDRQLYVDEMQFVKISLATTGVNANMDMKKYPQHRTAIVETLMSVCLDASHAARMPNALILMEVMTVSAQII